MPSYLILEDLLPIHTNLHAPFFLGTARIADQLQEVLIADRKKLPLSNNLPHHILGADPQTQQKLISSGYKGSFSKTTSEIISYGTYEENFLQHGLQLS